MITYGSITLTSYNTITKIEVYYYKSTSATSLSGGSWSTTKPTWENGKYIWQKIRTTYEGKLENGQYYSESNPVNITGQQGASGTSAYSYKLNASDTTITISKTGVYSTSKITFTATSKQGTGSVNAYAGRFKIETTANGTSWTASYTSSANESSKEYTVPTGIIAIRCSLYQAGGTSTLLDIVTIPILSDDRPIATKTYTGLIGSANDATNASFYFAKIHPDSYTTNYKVKMKVRVTAPEAYAETIDIQFGGYGSSFSSYDSYTTRTGSVGVYYINLYRATQAGISTNHKGHALGIGLCSSTNPTNTSYKRTIIVDILELDGCTIKMLDTAIKYANIDGTGSTNYYGLTEMAVGTTGQNATNNTNTHYTQYSNNVKAGTNGIKGYTLIMKDSENTWSCFYSGAYKEINTGKPVYTGGFMLGKILYSAGGGAQTSDSSLDTYYNYKSGVNTSTIYDAYPVDLRYSTNCMSKLTSQRPVYIVGTVESDGLFHLDVSQWYTQTEPTYADGKVYVYVGMAYSTYQVWLSTENPAYTYYDGEFILYDKAQTLQNINTLKNSLETQIDSKVETWCQKTNPASSWTAEERPNHTGDLWYYIGESGTTYKNNTTYQYNGETNVWSAYSANPDLFDKIDGKSAIYYGTTSSVTSAEEGDYLVDSENDCTYRWNNGAWVLATDYKQVAIDAIEIGGRNFLSKVNVLAQTTQYTEENYVYTGLYGHGAGLKFPASIFEVGINYVLSFKFQKINGTLTAIGGHCAGFSSFGNKFVIDGIKEENRTYSQGHLMSDDTNVHSVEVYLTFNGNASDNNLYIQPNRGAYIQANNNEFQIWDLQLEKGNKPTDWTPAPEDVEKKISTLRTDLQSQIDEKIQTFYQSTNPASSWTTAELRTPHDGDLWYYTGTTTSTYTKDNVYRYNASNNTWSAYSASGELFDKVDGKSTIYYGATSDDYTGVETGDYLVDSTDGSSYRWDGSKWVKVTDYQTTITNAIDNIQIGGRNLALDSSLTGNIQKWNPTVNRWTKTIKDDHECLMCKGSLNTTATLTVPLTINSESYGVVPYNGLQLVFSADVLLEDIVKGTTNYYLTLYPSGQTIDGTWRGATILRQSEYFDNTSLKPSKLNGMGWTRVWRVFKYNDYNWSAYLRPLFYARDFTGKVYVKNIKVEYGDYATDWTPAPEDVTSSIQTYVDTLQFQVDHMAEIYYGTVVPTLSNTPASDWDTNDIKDIHVDDLYYNTSTGYCYRFTKSGSTYSWTRIKDSDITAAATAASNANTAAGNAQTTANNANTLAGQKRRIFVAQPTPPYEVGDLWVEGSNGDIKKCKTARASGSYTASDWELASKYTDDTLASTANEKIDNLEIGGRNYFKCFDNSSENIISNVDYTYDKKNGTYQLTVNASNTGFKQIYTKMAVSNLEDILGQEVIMSISEITTSNANAKSKVYFYGTKSDGTIWLKSITPETEGLSISFTVESDLIKAGYILRVDQDRAENVGDTAIFRGLKLEKGNKATDWSPAPEDTETAISNVQDTANTALNQSVEYIVGTQTAATGSWTGVTIESELRDGKTIMYKLPFAGSGNASLQLTLSDGSLTENIPVYMIHSTTSNNAALTRVTTHYPAGSVIQMTYDSSANYWKTTGYNTNINYYDRSLYAVSLAASTAIAAVRIAVLGIDGKLHILNTTAFDIKCPPLYVDTAYSTSDVTKATKRSTNYSYWGSAFALTSTHAVTGAVAGKPVYIVGTLEEDTFTPTATVLTCTEPTSEDNLVYMRLGRMTTTANAVLEAEHPFYTYYDGAFRLLSEAEEMKAAKSATNYMSSDNTGIMVADMTDGVEKLPSDTTLTGSNVFITAGYGSGNTAVPAGVHIRDGRTDVARFGATTQIGKDNEGHVLIDNDSVDIKNGQNVLASFGENTYIGRSNGYHMLISPNDFIGISDSNAEYFKISGYISTRTLDPNKPNETIYETTGYVTGRYFSYRLLNTPLDNSIINVQEIFYDENYNELNARIFNRTYHYEDSSSSSEITSYEWEEVISEVPAGVANRPQQELIIDEELFDQKDGLQIGVHFSDATVKYVVFRVTYKPANSTIAVVNPYYTFGYRKDDYNVGVYSFAEGANVIASGDYSHAEGTNTTANKDYSHAEGSNTIASGYGSHAEGGLTVASGNDSHAEGGLTVASGNDSHAEGAETTASGDYSHAEGSNTTASGDCSHAEGSNTTANKLCSHAEGYNTIANGLYSHVEGNNTTASGSDSHAEGNHTTASGSDSHAEGNHTTASGLISHAEGHNTVASGNDSHAEGTETIASGNYSHAQNLKTISSKHAQTALGKYNKEDEDSSTYGKYVVIIGNGDSESNRSNALTISWDGNIQMALDNTVAGTEYNLYEAITTLGWLNEVIE